MKIALNLALLQAAAARFDRMTLRERALIFVAGLAAVLMLWNMVLMQPLVRKQKALQAELDEISTSMSTTAAAMEAAMEPINAVRAQLQSVQTELTTVDHELTATTAGMIAPQRMAEVVEDVLHRQHAVTLISLRNETVSSLVDSDVSDSDPATGKPSQLKTGPFVHPLQLVVEGSYSDIVDYLQTLEALPWRLYWNRLELESQHYPLNRVQIELSTLSLDDAWLGV